MTFGTLDFRAVQNAAATMSVETVHFGVLSFICLFLFVGATGKSAQIPLYVWLPDAMEGPDPGLRPDPRRDDGDRRLST